MFQLDEKILSDNRTLTTIQAAKAYINPLNKNGTLNYTIEDSNLWLTTPKIMKSYISKNDALDIYDKVVLARNGTNIDGNYEFDGAMTFNENVEMKKDLLIRGNLTVEGNSTVIDTPHLSIEDNIIELNKNEKGNGISLNISGSAINRGVNGFSRYLYSESNKAFVVDTSTSIDSNFVVGDNKWVTMAFTQDSPGNINGEFRVRRKLSVPVGLFNDSIQVINNATLNNLDATGNVNFTGNSVFSNTTINGVFVANNLSTFNNLLTANKPSVFNDTVEIKKNLTAYAPVLFKDTLTVNKKVNITSGGMDVIGSTLLANDLTVNGTARLKNDAIITGLTTTNNLNVLNDTSITRDLSVGRNALISNNLEVTNNLEVQNEATFNGISTFNFEVIVNHDSQFNKDVDISGGNLRLAVVDNVGGNINAQGGISAFGDLAIRGTSLLNGDVRINSDLHMNDQTAQIGTVVLDDNIIFRPGNDNGMQFDGNNLCKIYYSSAADPISGGRLDSSSTENLYFKNTTSTRGFVFKSGERCITQIEASGKILTINDIYSKNSRVLTRADEGHTDGGVNINADKLDGLHDYDFLRRNLDTNTTANITFSQNNSGVKFKEGSSVIEKDSKLTFKTSNAITHGFVFATETDGALLTIKNAKADGIMYKDHKVWHSGNQGHTTGLNADMLDGYHAESFSQSNHLHDDRYIRNDEVNLKGKYKIEYNQDFDCLDFMYMGDTP